MLTPMKNLVMRVAGLLGRLIVGIVCLVGLGFLTILGVLLFHIVFDPAGGVFMLFLGTYSIENHSGRGLEVTPIYNYRQDDSYHACYRFRELGAGRFGEVPIQNKIPIAAGERISVTWDSDSGVPVFLLVKDALGSEVKVLDLDEPGVATWSSAQNRYLIPSYDAIPRAPERMLPGFEGKGFTWLPPKELSALLASGT